jgi:hypothetical protein
MLRIDTMTVAELTNDIQFTVDRAGHITAVVLTPEAWQRILEALEDSEDRQLVAGLKSRLEAGPLKSGALRFEDVSDEWQ